MNGRLIVMGSGEMAPRLVATHREGLRAADASRVTVVDTPFGFQENVEPLTARLVEFFATSLQADSVVASLRVPNAAAVDRERFAAAVRGSRYLFAGPGSPSYALKVWHELDLAGALVDVIRRGGTVTFASAAALTLGERTIPVYEVYKVGEEPHWLEGMGVMRRLGLPCVVIPHWNNAEGGNHDTSRCYIGQRRLAELRHDLDVGIIGIDEHTAAVFDFAGGELRVEGVGGVVVIGEKQLQLASGEAWPLDDVTANLASAPTAVQARAEVPADRVLSFEEALAAADTNEVAASLLAAEEAAATDPGLRPRLRSLIVQLADAALEGLVAPRDRIRPFVESLLDIRAAARRRGDYAESDAIRDALLAAGVEVRDTPDGVIWVLKT